MEKPIGRMIKMIDEALIRRMNADLQEKNLTCGQLHMLLALSRAEEKTMPLKALEQQFQLAQSTVAGLAVRLEKKGLVENIADDSDRRVKRIRLTEAGCGVCSSCCARVEETERQLVSGLSEEEAVSFRDMLSRVLDAINRKE